MYIVLFLIIMLIPMSVAFADSKDCWFIFCWFDFSEKTSNEENLAKHQQKVKSAVMNQMRDEISSLRQAKNTISDGLDSKIDSERNSLNDRLDSKIDSKMNSLNDGIDNRIDLLEEILDTEEDMKNNPDKYLTNRDLVDRAMNYYKLKPDGTACDEDRRWVDDRNACVRMKTAYKVFNSWDLEWLQDHPELD